VRRTAQYNESHRLQSAVTFFIARCVALREVLAQLTQTLKTVCTSVRIESRVVRKAGNIDEFVLDICRYNEDAVCAICVISFGL